MSDGLAKTHRIIEKGLMDHRPFGLDPAGKKIRDVSGVTVRANIEYLEQAVTRRHGPGAGHQRVRDLCGLLNGRIPDPAYRVTPEFLRNVWHSYSYEFVMFLGEFAADLSEDPQFHYNVGKEALLTPLIQTLGRPFSVTQIYRLFPHFGQKFAKDSLQYEVGQVTDGTARLRMRYAEHVYRQFGVYRRRCAYLVCQSAKAGLAAVPERIHGLPPARVTDLHCVAEGDDLCEWEFTWVRRPRASRPLLWLPSLLGGGAFAHLVLTRPQIGIVEAAGLTLLPAGVAWAAARWGRHGDLREREQLIQEQLRSVEARHEELREAYLDQEQTTVRLRQTVGQLGILHRLGIGLTATLDRDAVLETVLATLTDELGYDHAMLVFVDPIRRCTSGTRLWRAPDAVAAAAGALEIPCADPDTLEGLIVRRGQAVLLHDLDQEWGRLHPLHRRLVAPLGAKTLIVVPVRAKDRTVAWLTVDRLRPHTLSALDVEALTTVAAQVAVALDNAEAYQQIERLNVQLESKVAERTAALDRANRELTALNLELAEANRLKSAFVSIASHELRTPLTAIKGFLQNLLDGVTGPLTEKQTTYLSRAHHNADRLRRLVDELLDLSRIESGAVEIHAAPLPVEEVVSEAVEELRPLAVSHGVVLEVEHRAPGARVQADRDKLAQILTNLLHNAMTFAPGGRVRVLTGRRGPEVIISVIDDGPGLRDDETEKVFLRFYRGASAPPGSRGAGLGLAIAKALVELHGGRIWAERGRERGACFSLTLPAVSAGC